MLKTLGEDWSVLKCKYLYFTCSAKSKTGASLEEIFYVHHHHVKFFCVAVAHTAANCSTLKLMSGFENKKTKQNTCLSESASTQLCLRPADCVRMQRTDCQLPLGPAWLGLARPGLRTHTHTHTLTIRWLCCSVMNAEGAERNQSSVWARQRDGRTTLSAARRGLMPRYSAISGWCRVLLSHTATLLSCIFWH